MECTPSEACAPSRQLTAAERLRSLESLLRAGLLHGFENATAIDGPFLAGDPRYEAMLSCHAVMSAAETRLGFGTLLDRANGLVQRARDVHRELGRPWPYEEPPPAETTEEARAIRLQAIAGMETEFAAIPPP